MKYINEDHINNILAHARRASPAEVDTILAKARALNRLSLEETAVLLAADTPDTIEKIYTAAAFVKQAVYGSRVVLFAPLYISNTCANNCLYCAFRSGNTAVTRKTLSAAEIEEQVRWLLERGHKRLLAVAGEPAGNEEALVDYYVSSIAAIYAARAGENRIRRVNINCAPLSVESFRRLKSAGIGTYQIFQETYHEATYRDLHPSGPKSDPDNRVAAVDRAFAAGIDDIGIGVLYGLYDYRFDTLAMLMHIEEMERTHRVGPHTISVPRIEPAPGVPFTTALSHHVSDEEFKKVVAVLRLSVPYTGIILSTRETADMRTELLSLGVSQMSAESRTAPGGYATTDNNKDAGIQFTLGDQRTLDDVVGALIEKGMLPSFCAACYRQQRTGEAFMNLAKPGTIKGTCSVNALVTLKEYLDDFASEKVRRAGYALIKSAGAQMDEKNRNLLTGFFNDIDRGIRDRYL